MHVGVLFGCLRWCVLLRRKRRLPIVLVLVLPALVVESVTPTPAPTPDTIRSWGAAEVAKWALTIRSIDYADAAILAKNKITGEDLLDRVTKADLVAVGMPLGPAGRIMSALAAAQSVEAPVVPTCMGEWVGASRCFVHDLRLEVNCSTRCQMLL